MTEFIIFAIRYIPFWVIPVVFISLPFAYVFWLKDVRILTYFFAGIAVFSSIFLIIWIWLGGPDASVKFYFDAVRSF